jgi:hypothetical protein
MNSNHSTNEKTCSKCKITKTLDEFYRKGKDGFRCWCKECTRQDNSNREHRYSGYRKSYREENKGQIKEHKRIYYLNNRERINKVNANYRTSLNYRFAAYKNNAKHRKIEWSLTKDEFAEMWNLDCYYCGQEIPLIGVDRVDSSMGYVKNNVVSCCSLCNVIKMDLSYEDFLTQAKRIYEYSNSKGRYDTFGTKGAV